MLNFFQLALSSCPGLYDTQFQVKSTGVGSKFLWGSRDGEWGRRVTVKDA